MGPVARWLRRQVFWTAGLSVADVLFLVVFFAAGLGAIALLVIAAASRTP